MSPTIEEQIEGIKRTIAEMEDQRESLGDEVVDAGLVPFRRKLDELIAMLKAREAQPPAEPARQRKLVTLLFMDIAGSTSIAQHMDPEDVGEVFDAALTKLAQPIQEHGGRVTRFMGDGFLSVFGAPTAREDDPERAVRAGLEIIKIAQELAPQLLVDWDIPDFQVRVGINTGLVLLGGKTEAEDTLMGAAVNLAARLESAAPPGGLLISHDTYRHIRGVFDVKALEPISVKGFDEPVRVYHVQRVRPRAFRLYTRGVEGIETRMVGREAELKYLQDALLTAIEEGEGHIVTIAGEAGVGKSRLLYEFQDWIELLPPPAVRFFEGRARQEAQGMPYGLLRDLFEFRFQIQDNDSAQIARQKISAGFEEVLGSDQEGKMRTHLLGQWLGYDFSDSPYLKGVLTDAEQLRSRCLMYLVDYFKALSGHAPVVIFLEDIHWADDSSLDAFHWVEERLHNQSLIVVCAARPTLFKRRPYWGEELSYHRRLELEPLSRRESHRLVREILKLADQIPSELSELLVEGAEGNPFYLEELVKMLVEDGVIVKGEDSWQVHPEPLPDIEVPPTLAGVLQARLDSLLPHERKVLQQASVVGRQFWDRVVAYIQAEEGGNPQAIPKTLIALSEREMIFHREKSDFVDTHEYLFRHDILREVAYELVLKRLRRLYHGLVADWLIEHSGERVNEYAGLIADHYINAGNWEKSWTYLLQAAKNAQERFANQEAVDFFDAAIGISPYLKQLEVADLVDVHILKADVLNGMNKYEEELEELNTGLTVFTNQAPATTKHGTMARIYQKMGDALRSLGKYSQAIDVIQMGINCLPEGHPEEMGALELSLASVLTRQGDLEAAQQWCIDGIENVEKGENLEQLGHAYNLLGTILRDLGDTTSSLEFRLKSLKIGQDIANIVLQMEAHNNLAVAYYDLGQLLKAVIHYEHSRDLSERIGNINTSARAEYNLGEVYLIKGDWDKAEGAFHHALTNWELTGYKLGQAYACFGMGAVLSRKEMTEMALEYLERSRTLSIEIGAHSFLPTISNQQATVYLMKGDLIKAKEFSLSSLNQARELSTPLEEGIALRILGMIYHGQDLLKQSQEHLEASVNIFSERGIQYEEARSKFELARLWHDQFQYDRFKSAIDDAIECFRKLGAEVDLRHAEAFRTELPPSL